MKIKSLEIENFKVFGKRFDKITDIANLSLILLNGPNGYGKTTLFDAIELALTGQIKRINTYTKDLDIKKTETHEKFILITDETKEAYVKLVLKSENDIIEIRQVYYPTKNRLQKVSKKKNPNAIFNRFTCELKINGKEVEADNIDSELEQYGLKDIKDFYDKCCFLSQDEHLGFLKETSQNKASALEFLFEVPAEQTAEVTRVNEIMYRLKNNNRVNNRGVIQILDDKEKKLQEEIKNLEEKIENFVENRESIEYKRIFLEQIISWDQEIKDISGEEYDEAIQELDKLVYFSEHQEECLNYIFNKPYDDILKTFVGNDYITYKENSLEYTYRYYPLIKQEEIIESKYTKQQKFNTLKEVLENKKLEIINWKFISEENLISDDLTKIIREKIKQISDLEKTQGIVSSVISKMKKTRTTFMNQRKDAIEKVAFDDKTCPLCGTPFDERKILEEKMLEETNILQALCDESGEKIEIIISGLYEEYFNSLLEKVNESLKDEISKEVYLRLQKVKADKKNILNTKDLLDKIDISLSENYQEDSTQLNIEYDDLQKRIVERLRNVSEEIKSQLDAYDFVHAYEKFYNKDEDAFKKVTVMKLKEKKSYTEQMYYNSSVKTLDVKKKEKGKISQSLKEANEYYSKLERYLSAIQDGIGAYKRKIIQDIEPLLYVYTAKILQQKFNGKSIFIHFDEDKGEIGFVNSVEDNQNILYSMSSGQLAAVALSFLLCMNQVYSKNTLPILLIDDPIQTIDDVNMVGLVDILRYEFEDSQIFISTHEQKFEWYLRYKYEKTGKAFKPFNMRKLLLEENY